MSHDALSTGSNNSQPINSLSYGANQPETHSKPPNKVDETSKIPLSELKNLSTTTKLDESHILTKQELNGENGEDLATEEKTHEVGKATLLPDSGSFEVNDLDSSQLEPKANAVDDSAADSIEDKPMEEMSEEELMAFLEKQSELDSDLEEVESDLEEVKVQIEENDTHIDENLDEKAAIKSHVTNTFLQLLSTPQDLLRATREMVNGVLRTVKLQADENIEEKILSKLASGKLVFFTGKDDSLKLPVDMKPFFEALGFAEVEDDNGEVIRIPANQIQYLDKEEFEQFINDIREHIGKMPAAHVDVDEYEVEKEKETKHEEVHSHHQQPISPEHPKADHTKNSKDRHPFADADKIDRGVKLTIAEINQRRIDDFNQYMSIKMEKIRKKIKQEELNEEHIKHDELKSSIKSTDAKRHETHIDIAQTEADYKQLQQRLNTLSESTYTVPARKLFKELQVIIDKINTSNPREKNFVAIKKEIVEVAREIVKFSNEMKSVSEGSDRISGGGMA